MADRTDVPQNARDQDDAEVLHTLRDLWAGQQQATDVLQQLTVAIQRLGMPRRPSPHRDENRSDAGSQRAPRTVSRTTDRPTRPIFVRQEPDEAIACEEHEGLFADTLMAANDEWELVPPEVRERISFDRFITQRREHHRGRQDWRPRHNNNSDLKHATNRLTLAMFDGSGKVTAQAWISKLDTFLTLRPMAEEDAIRYATLHLEGAAYDWWHHGMVTLQHDCITTY